MDTQRRIVISRWATRRALWDRCWRLIPTTGQMRKEAGLGRGYEVAECASGIASYRTSSQHLVLELTVTRFDVEAGLAQRKLTLRQT